MLGTLISSSSNNFEEVIEGVRLTIHGASDTTQSVNIQKNADTITSPVKLFVEQYNKLREKIKEISSFNAEDKTVGVLFSSNEILQIDLEFGQVLTSRYFSTGAIQSFEQIGVSPDAQGLLQFDEQKFRTKYEADPADVAQFFTTASNGAAARLIAAAERLSGRDSSMLVNRATALQRTIDNHQLQISKINTSLERQREQMVKQFSRLETVISNMQSNLSWLSRIQPIPFATRNSR